MKNLGVQFVDTRDILGRDRFFHFIITRYLFQSKSNEKFWRMKTKNDLIIFPVKMVCIFEISSLENDCVGIGIN